MSTTAMLPCLVCGRVLANVMHDAMNQPSAGTEFATYGHYGSTFWDSFDGEQIVINVCDPCLTERKDRLGRHKRFRRLHVNRFSVGREWLEREMVPYFDGPEDQDDMEISVDDLTEFEGQKHVELFRDQVAYAREHRESLETRE